MTNKTKTPGEVDHAAFQQAQCKWLDTRVRSWEEETLGIQNCHEAAAQAVREQVGGMDDRGAEAISRLGALQRRLARWRDTCDSESSYYWAYQKLIDIVEPFFPVSPRPESAEACAENAGAEPSKSPPPAKR